MPLKNHKQLLAVLLALAVSQGFAPPAHAWFFGWWGHDDHHGRDYGPGRGHGGPGPGYDRGCFSPHYGPVGHHRHDLGLEYTRLVLHGLEFFYWEGMFYRHEQGEYVAVAAPVGAVVTALPAGYQAYVVNGATYYTINGVTYLPVANGYQVVNVGAPAAVVTPAVSVAAPAVTVPAATVGDVMTVNVPNNHGTYTAVSLRRSGAGYVGPQGEYYSEFPRVDQLQAMYGK